MRRTLGIAVLAVIAGLSTLVSRADAAIITYTAVLSGLARSGRVETSVVTDAMSRYEIDPEAVDPAHAH